MTDAERIARKVLKLRKEADLSLAEAAERIGVTKSHLWEFEKGRTKNPSLNMLRGLADCYGISLTDLIGKDVAKPRIHPDAMKIAIQVDQALRRAKERT